MKNLKLIIVAMIVCIIIVSIALVYSIPGDLNDEFAKCLTEKGAEIYGSYKCPACQKQKLDFGDSFQYINYFECDPNGPEPDIQSCIDNGIEKLPTWVYNGEKYIGYKSFNELSEITGCEL